MRACEGKVLTIMCDDGGYIQITFANYGRLDYSTCTFPASWTDNCRARESLAIVANRCNGLPTCEIEASNDIFGNPCWGTNKYLEVRYYCTEGNFWITYLRMMVLLARILKVTNIHRNKWLLNEELISKPWFVQNLMFIYVVCKFIEESSFI